MKFKRKKLFTLIAGIVLLAMLTACGSNQAGQKGNVQEGNNKQNPKSQEEPILIGSTLSLTGGFAFYGTAFKEGMDLLVEEINAEGGINGRPLVIKYYDDENNPELAVRNANKLIKEDKVNIIIGPNSAATSKAVEPIAEQNKVIMYSASGAYVGPPNSYSFASSYAQDAMHDLIHQWLKKEGITKAGMIASNDGSGDISVNLVNELNGKDGIHYVIERMGVQDTDITPQLTKMRNEKIGALVVIGPGAPAGAAIQNAVKLNFKIPIIATHSQATAGFARSIKDFIPEKMLFTSPPVMGWQELSEANPLKKNLEEFDKKFQAKYNKPFELGQVVGYDTLSIVVEGLKKYGDDPAKIKEYLENEVKDFVGVHAVFNLTPEDHRGTSSEGVVMLRLDKDLSWHVEWEPSN